MCYSLSMKRLYQWDYRQPFHYMVTLKCLPGLPPLSLLKADDRWDIDPSYPLTQALAETIHAFVAQSPGISAICPFSIMPDHLHLLIKLSEDPERHSLKGYVKILRAKLAQTFCEVTGLNTPLFEPDWHDLIVKRRHQLSNFTHYICNNAHMRLLRQSHATAFQCTRAYAHWRLDGLPVDLVGTPELLDEPALLAVRISRKVLEGTPEWEETMDFYAHWRPGMTAVGTWWSKGEKAAARKILERGGNLIYLTPHGFPERWHPAGDEAQKLCTNGRLLYLTPYPPQTRQLPEGETRRRCLELNALAQKMQAAIACDA